MRAQLPARPFLLRSALTLACLSGLALSWPAAVTPGRAQTGRFCTNTSCQGLDRCIFWGEVNCSMTREYCLVTKC